MLQVLPAVNEDKRGAKVHHELKHVRHRIVDKRPAECGADTGCMARKAKVGGGQ